MSDSQNHHDITHLLTPFFDRQLIIPFLEFLSGKEIYKEEHILNAKIELLRGTKMADALVEIYETMGETAPDDLLARREAIVADYRLREQEITNIVGAIERIQQDEDINLDLETLQRELQEDAVEAVHRIYHYGKLQYDTGNYPLAIEYLDVYSALAPSSDKYSMSAIWGTMACYILNQNWDQAEPELDINLDLETLQRELQEDAVEAVHRIYHYGKLQYDTGNYPLAIEYLDVYSALAPSSDKYSMSVIWGTMACYILNQNWDQALEDLKRLRQIIDQNSATANPLQSLQQRTWLIHWGLFVYFNHPKGRDLLIDHCLVSDQQYLNAIQTQCPHILRYLCVAVIANKRRRNVMKDLVKIIEQESYAYKDPITQFVSCLFVDYDFDGAQNKLKECEAVITNDFFSTACTEDFMENARLYIFEMFCRIHQVISIDMLARKLNMGAEQAEQWIVNLIRDARMDAKIDSQKGHVLMGTVDVTVYQQVLDKVRALQFRTQQLANNLNKLSDQHHSNQSHSSHGYKSAGSASSHQFGALTNNKQESSAPTSVWNTGAL